jgi:hypothetical protein
LPGLLLKSFEPVRHFWTFVSFIRELPNEQPERLGVAGNPQRANIHRIETGVADQFSGHRFAALVVAAVHQTRSCGVALGFVHAEKDFARHGVECRDDLRVRQSLYKFLRADEVCATTSSVLSAFIGREQLTMTLPDKSPA